MPLWCHRLPLFFGVLLLSLAALPGCGPITATTSIAEATVAVEAARGAQADKYAIYEFHSAVLHLRKAREEEGYSDFQDAVNLAHKARKLAEKAKDLAMSSDARDLPPPPAAAPSGPASGDRL